MFVYFPLKHFNLWNKMKHILLRQSAHVLFNRYCCHCVINNSQCICIIGFTWTEKIWGSNVRWPPTKSKKIQILIRTRKFDLNLGPYFFHKLSLILFLFCSYIFTLSLDWATVFFFCSSVVETIPHLVDKLFLIFIC